MAAHLLALHVLFARNQQVLEHTGVHSATAKALQHVLRRPLSCETERTKIILRQRDGRFGWSTGHHSGGDTNLMFRRLRRRGKGGCWRNDLVLGKFGFGRRGPEGTNGKMKASNIHGQCRSCLGIHCRVCGDACSCLRVLESALVQFQEGWKATSLATPCRDMA